MAEVVQPAGWPAPRGYSHGMLAKGTLLAVAGQVGWDLKGRMVSRDFAAQFIQALDNVLAVVGAAGGAGTDIISMTIYVTDTLKYVACTDVIGRAWRERLGRHYPAMALVEVAALLEADALVEIQVLAAIPDGPARGAP